MGPALAASSCLRRPLLARLPVPKVRLALAPRGNREDHWPAGRVEGVPHELVVCGVECAQNSVMGTTDGCSASMTSKAGSAQWRGCSVAPSMPQKSYLT